VPRSALDEIGVNVGDQLTVRSRRGSLRLPVRLDESLPRHVALIVANLAGPGGRGASALVDSSSRATDVWLEKA
jgi:hypothetical protein